MTLGFGGELLWSWITREWRFTGVFREIETAVPDERVPVLYVLYILLARSYNIKVNIFGLNEVKIEIDSPGAGL